MSRCRRLVRDACPCATWLEYCNWMGSRLAAAVVFVWLASGNTPVTAQQDSDQVRPQVRHQATSEHAPRKVTSILYRNTKYGFTFRLPESWRGYSVVIDTWHGTKDEKFDFTRGPTISIRNPGWTDADPWQDLPVMVFTHAQWKMLQDFVISVGAAPYNSGELGRNRRYVFALPARFDYADVRGVEEADGIIRSNPLRAY